MTLERRQWWRKETRGGYGTITRVPVVVLGTSLRRVRVLVPVVERMQSRMGQAVVRSVKPASLTPRDEPDPIDAIAEARES